MNRSFRAVGALALVIFVFAVPVSAAPFTYPAPVLETFPAPEAPDVTAASWIGNRTMNRLPLPGPSL